MTRAQSLLSVRSFAVLATALLAARAAHSQSAVIGWGTQVYDSRVNDEVFVEVAADPRSRLEPAPSGVRVGKSFVPTLR